MRTGEGVDMSADWSGRCCGGCCGEIAMFVDPEDVAFAYADGKVCTGKNENGAGMKTMTIDIGSGYEVSPTGTDHVTDSRKYHREQSKYIAPSLLQLSYTCFQSYNRR